MEMELTKKRVLSLRQIGWAVTLVYALLGCLLIVMPGYHAGDPLLSSSIGGSLRDWAYLASSSVLVYFLSQFFARKLIQGDYRISVDRTDDEKESRLRVHSTVFESIMEGVAVTDADVKIISVNPAFTHITGFKPEEVLGKNPNIMKSGRHDEEFYRRMWESIIEHGSWSGEVWNRRRNGSIKPEWLNITRVCNDAGATTNYVASFIDTSAIRASQEQLHHLAHHDNLTGLPNRLLLKDRLDQSFKRARREKCQVAVLFLDLDEFKKINDTLGHKVGDEVLKQAARRIQALLRKEDTVARLGGDEFVILLDRLDRAEDASLVARKVLSTLRQPFTIANRELYIGVSIGISIFPQDGEDSDKLVRNADIAMYRAKQLGKNLFQFYTEALSETANYKMELEADLRNALEAGQLQLFYQPQVSLADRRIVGAEALLRWQHPEQGLIPAAEFIQLAEETGLIMPIGEWVLQEACRQLLTWDEQGAQRLRISLNISGVQLHRSALFELVQSVLQKSGVQPDRLEFDIGESTFLAVTEKNLDVLHRLQSLGVGLAIDDFGAGYTSFGYLQRLHADRLKLSRSLLEGVPSNRDKSVIVDAITSLGEKFGIPILAAGIETEEQLHFAHKIGCKTGQGFLFAEALPPDRFQRFS